MNPNQPAPTPAPVEFRPQMVGRIISGSRQPVPGETSALAIYHILGIVVVGDLVLIATMPLLFWFALVNAMLILASLPLIAVLVIMAMVFAIRVKIESRMLKQSVSRIHTVMLFVTPIVSLLTLGVVQLLFFMV